MRWPFWSLFLPRSRREAFLFTTRTGCPGEESRVEETTFALQVYAREEVTKAHPRVVR